MRTRGVLGWSVLLAVVLTGCPGDGNGSTVTTVGGTTTSVASTTTAQPQDPAKAAKAKAAVLQPGDFPAGWAAKPEDERLDHETTWRELTRCLGSEDSGQGVASALSPSFARGPATQVTSAVEYLSASSAAALATAFGGPKLASCAEQAFVADVKRNAPEGSTPGAVQVAPLDVPKLGQLTSAFRASTPLDMGGFEIKITQDFVIVFKDDSVSRVSFLGAGQPFNTELQNSLVGKVVGRA
jgi:hypothetical protein